MPKPIDPELKGFTQEELIDLLRLQVRVAHDYRPVYRGALGLLFVFSQTPDNADSLFHKFGQMRRNKEMELLGITDGDLGHGYAGFRASVDRICELGPYLMGFPYKRFDVGGNVNTGSEAKALAEYCKSEGITDVGVLAVPFMQLRAFMTAMTALRNAGLDRTVRLYSYSGEPLDWQKKVAHSQGTLIGQRKDFLKSELERIDRYRGEKYGSLASAQEVLDYLDWRDS